jgi:proteic killer suppression protein
VILSFRSKALERFWWKGETRRVDARHVKKLHVILALLETVPEPADMDKAGLHFHPLTGDQDGRFSVRVDKNWRVTFGWASSGPDAVDVDYEDYH